MITFLQLGKHGRLGNQLFQIAATIGIAVKNGQDFSFPEWGYSKFLKNSLPLVEVKKYLIQHEKTFCFSDFNIDSDKDYNVFGYLQSEKYFAHCKDFIKEILSPKEEIKEELRKRFDFEDSISLHVRRGDYLSIQDIHPSQTIEYYRKSIEYIGKDKKIIVFSDDIEWCRENLKFDNIFFSEEKNEFYDLILMSMCKHHITANSSFSWWGSWLGEKQDSIIVSPKNWFGINAPYTSIDIIPERWTII